HLNLQDLKKVRAASLQSVLEFLKARNWDFKEVIVTNLEFYDYVARIARDLGDNDFAEHLDGYMLFAIQVRMAREFADEVERQCDTDGTIPLARLVPIVERIPSDSRDMSLELLVRQGTIPDGIARDLTRLMGQSN